MKKLILSLLVMALAMPAFAVELMAWDRIPLKVNLKVNEERVLFVDKNVRVGMEAESANLLRVQSVAGTVYLKALEEITVPVRIQIQDADSSEVIIVDVATLSSQDAPSVPLEPVRIVDARAIVAADEKDKAQNKPDVARVKVSAPVALTRYAAQSLYAPQRTVEPVPGLRRVPLRVEGSLRLMPTTTVVGIALVAYRLGDYTVTAVQLTNTGNEVVPLDPRKIQGNFYAATFQHSFLSEDGTPEDTTVVYLVTKGMGLDGALLPSALIEEKTHVKGTQ